MCVTLTLPSEEVLSSRAIGQLRVMQRLQNHVRGRPLFGLARLFARGGQQGRREGRELR